MQIIFTDTSYFDQKILADIREGKKQLNTRALALVIKHQNKLIDDAHFQAYSMCQRSVEFTGEGLMKL